MAVPNPSQRGNGNSNETVRTKYSMGRVLCYFWGPPLRFLLETFRVDRTLPRVNDCSLKNSAADVLSKKLARTATGDWNERFGTIDVYRENLARKISFVKDWCRSYWCRSYWSRSMKARAILIINDRTVLRVFVDWITLSPFQFSLGLISLPRCYNAAGFTSTFFFFKCYAPV